MVISSYQVNNVLRVYKGQLRHSKIMNITNNNETRMPDKVSISPEAKRKAIIERVTSDIVDRLVQNGPHNNVEKEVFKKLESEYGGHLAIGQEGSIGLLFKEIDENGETTNSLSIEDSKFLTQKLEEITKDTVSENLF